ncbi:hypothetical protein HXA35_01425 [Bacillus sp. A301a_S52]|nr:hypothetical protein [Bacillus sp. A301a_S52]
MSQTKYELKQSLIIREQDNSIFDSEKLNILSFNPSGFELINHLDKYKVVTAEEFLNYAKEIKVSEEDFNEFINKCLNQDIIKIISTEPLI